MARNCREPLTVSWLELSMTVDGERAETIETVLTEAGAQAVTLFPELGQSPVLEPAPSTTPLWTTLVARGLFPASHDPDLLRLAVDDQLHDSERASIQFEILADQPWERAWLEHFQPVRFGQRQNLCICPWEHTPKPDGEVLFMDPGLAFGTGSHATTALCLDYLADSRVHGQSVLDLGCGSGVLGLTAALRGAGPVFAVDNDPQACLATRDNARRNRLPITVTDHLHNVPGPVDLIVANILSGILVDYAADLGKLARQGTVLVMSGILAEQADMVRTAYQSRFDRFEQAERDGWVRLSAVARA